MLIVSRISELYILLDSGALAFCDFKTVLFNERFNLTQAFSRLNRNNSFHILFDFFNTATTNYTDVKLQTIRFATAGVGIAFSSVLKIRSKAFSAFPYHRFYGVFNSAVFSLYTNSIFVDFNIVFIQKSRSCQSKTNIPYIFSDVRMTQVHQLLTQSCCIPP